ncbi:MAG: hypothetical protein R3C58_15810 [Parvularculaceae bacterium]
MLNFFIAVFVALAVLGGLYWLWRRKIDAEVAEGAAHEWALFQKNEPAFVAGMSEEKFRKVYARVHTPRFPAYALAAIATFLLSLPVTFALLSAVAWGADMLGFLPEPLEIVRYVHLGEISEPAAGRCNQECQLQLAESFSGFYYFFGVIAMWLTVVFFFTRRFHARRPGYLRDEIIRARE